MSFLKNIGVFTTIIIITAVPLALEMQCTESSVIKGINVLGSQGSG